MRDSIGLIFEQVIREVRPLMLNVEPGLADSIEPGHQFGEAGWPCYQYTMSRALFHPFDA